MPNVAPPGGGGNVTGGQAFVDEAASFIGVPYAWGGESPSGFDCSGLVQYAAEQVGLSGVPRTSEEQWGYVQHVSKDQLQPGDLVFYTFPGEVPPGHVTIYAGNGQIIQAPSQGQDVQQVQMYGGQFGYGRIPGIGSASTSAALAKAVSGGGAGSSGGGAGSSGGGGLFGWLSSVWRDVGSGVTDLSPFSGASDVAQAIGGMVAPLKMAGEAIDWFFVPNHWIRIGCLLGGSGLVLVGIVTMARTGRSYSVSNPLAGASAAGFSLPSQLPAPGGELAPALGIAEVTAGAILLFFAFHNLPPTVKTFGGFLGFLTQQVRGQQVTG